MPSFQKIKDKIKRLETNIEKKRVNFILHGPRHFYFVMEDTTMFHNIFFEIRVARRRQQ